MFLSLNLLFKLWLSPNKREFSLTLYTINGSIERESNSILNCKFNLPRNLRLMSSDSNEPEDHNEYFISIIQHTVTESVYNVDVTLIIEKYKRKDFFDSGGRLLEIYEEGGRPKHFFEFLELEEYFTAFKELRKEINKIDNTCTSPIRQKNVIINWNTQTISNSYSFLCISVNPLIDILLVLML